MQLGIDRREDGQQFFRAEICNPFTEQAGYL
jgi:hypothetical protein